MYVIYYMRITKQNNVKFFGQKVPTEPLLKSAVKLHKFEDAKSLNQAIGIKYSGHISFYERAINISNRIIKLNPDIEKLVSNLKTLNNAVKQQEEINRIKKEIGETIDVIIPTSKVSGFKSYITGLNLQHLTSFIINGEEQL